MTSAITKLLVAAVQDGIIDAQHNAEAVEREGGPLPYAKARYTAQEVIAYVAGYVATRYPNGI